MRMQLACAVKNPSHARVLCDPLLGWSYQTEVLFQIQRAEDVPKAYLTESFESFSFKLRQQKRFRRLSWLIQLLLVFPGTQLRVQRPAAARPRASIVRATVGKGESQADQKAEDDVEQMGAPEGDRALAGPHTALLINTKTKPGS